MSANLSNTARQLARGLVGSRSAPRALFHTSRFCPDSSLSHPEIPHAESSQSAARAARARAWYLDDEEAPREVSSDIRKPRFTIFDPLLTTEIAKPHIIRPFPQDGPDYLRPIYDFLTSDEVAEALDASTVTLLSTRSRRKHHPLESDQIKGEEEVGPTWRWIIIAEVRGTTKGVLARADRLVRRWLYDNPVIRAPPNPSYHGRRPKLPRLEEDAEWSIVKVLEDDSCVNIFTKAGNEKYDLEELWTGRPDLSI